MRRAGWGLLLVVQCALPATLAAEVATYHVKFRYDGATGFYYVDPPGCPSTGHNGYDEFEGDLKGDESGFATNQQVVYRGVLKRKTELDACDLLPEDADGVANYCNVHIVGGGEYSFEMTVYADRTEIYSQYRPRKGKVSYTANGSCETDVIQDYARFYQEEEEAIEHWIGPRVYSEGMKVGGPPKQGTHPDWPPYPPHMPGHWKLIVGPPSELKAIPGGPYRIERAAEVVLDGTRSTGAITDYIWTLQPESCPDWAAPVSVHGATVRIKPLCPVKAKLEVTDGTDSDDAETSIAIVPRPWKTETPNPIRVGAWLTGENLVKPCGCNYGRNICAVEYNEGGMGSDGHRIHRDIGATTWEHTGFELGQHSDPSGLFDQWWYVSDNLLKVHRAEMLNVELAPGGILDSKNRPAHAADLDELIKMVRDHERTHTDLQLEELRRSDPAKEIETCVRSPGKRADLLTRVDDTIKRAEAAILDADSEPNVIAKLVAKYPGSATILQRVAGSSGSNSRWDTVTHPVLGEAAGD